MKRKDSGVTKEVVCDGSRWQLPVGRLKLGSRDQVLTAKRALLRATVDALADRDCTHCPHCPQRGSVDSYVLADAFVTVDIELYGRGAAKRTMRPSCRDAPC